MKKLFLMIVISGTINALQNSKRWGDLILRGKSVSVSVKFEIKIHLNHLASVLGSISGASRSSSINMRYRLHICQENSLEKNQRKFSANFKKRVFFHRFGCKIFAKNFKVWLHFYYFNVAGKQKLPQTFLWLLLKSHTRCH